MPWGGLLEEAVEFRHFLHRHPELTWCETETARVIRERLSDLKIPWRECAGTGTVGVLAPHAPGRHMALRADIDALPIVETTGADWASEYPGAMHACGHDGHTATLMTTARWLKLHEDALPGPVSLIFQPAEEGGHGAKKMIEDGALAGVDAIFGWHNWPAIPFGQAVCPDGPVMAANGSFSITVRGRGGHASQPEACRDPIVGASAIILALQQIVSRRLPPQQAAVVSVTSIHAPSAETVIPETVTLLGSLRVANGGLRQTVTELITRTAQDSARAYGVVAEVEIRPRYEATVNHPIEADMARTALAAELGPSWQHQTLPIPVMASEDFSYYLNEIPGAFALIGANDGPAHDKPCHSPQYDFNDALIPRVVAIFARIVGAPLPTA